MGRNTSGLKKDDVIAIRVPHELKDRIRGLMVGPYQHLELQQMILLLIEKGFSLHSAGVTAEHSLVENETDPLPHEGKKAGEVSA